MRIAKEKAMEIIVQYLEKKDLVGSLYENLSEKDVLYGFDQSNREDCWFYVICTNDYPDIWCVGGSTRVVVIDGTGNLFDTFIISGE